MAGQVTAVGLRNGDPAVLRALLERRGAAVLAYCERMSAPGKAPDAAAEAFARFRAIVMEATRPTDIDPESALLSATRYASAALAPRTAQPTGPGGLGRLLGGRSAEQLTHVPDLLVARAEGQLDAASDEHLNRLLDGSAAARAAEERFHAAEHAYRTAVARPIPPRVAEHIASAMLAVGPAPPAAPSSAEPVADDLQETVEWSPPFVDETPPAPRVPGPAAPAGSPAASAPPPSPPAQPPAVSAGAQPPAEPAASGEEDAADVLSASAASEEEAKEEPRRPIEELLAAEAAAAGFGPEASSPGRNGQPKDETSEYAPVGGGQMEIGDDDRPREPSARGETPGEGDRDPGESSPPTVAGADDEVPAEPSPAGDVASDEASEEPPTVAEATGEPLHPDVEDRDEDGFGEYGPVDPLDETQEWTVPTEDDPGEELEVEVAAARLEDEADDEQVQSASGAVDEAEPVSRTPAPEAAVPAPPPPVHAPDDDEKPAGARQVVAAQDRRAATAARSVAARPSGAFGQPEPAKPAKGRSLPRLDGERPAMPGRSALAPAAAVIVIAAVGAMVASGVFGGNDASPELDTGIVQPRALSSVPEGEAASVIADLRSAADTARQQRLADKRFTVPAQGAAEQGNQTP